MNQDPRIFAPFVGTPDGTWFWYTVDAEGKNITDTHEDQPDQREWHIDYQHTDAQGYDVFDIEYSPADGLCEHLYRGRIPDRESFVLVMTHLAHTPPITLDQPPVREPAPARNILDNPLPGDRMEYHTALGPRTLVWCGGEASGMNREQLLRVWLTTARNVQCTLIPRSEAQDTSGWSASSDTGEQSVTFQHAARAHSSAAEIVAAMPDTEYRLRVMLALAAAGSRGYYDDGELQDNGEHPYIDYLRDSPEAIKAKYDERVRLYLAERARRGDGV